MTIIREEKSEDRAAVYEVNRLAFGRAAEAKLVEAVRNSDGSIPELSLVAEKDGQIIGHILFSLITIETQTGAVPALALAPLAVTPELQRQGVGSQLVRRGLDVCRSNGHGIVILVGHPDYYPRFGFSPAGARGLETTLPVSDEAFMAIELVPGALDGIKGTVRYPPAFDEAT